MKRLIIAVFVLVVFLAPVSARASGPQPEELYNVNFWQNVPPLTRGVWRVWVGENPFYVVRGGCFGYTEGHFGIFDEDWTPKFEVPENSLVQVQYEYDESSNPDFFTVSNHGILRLAGGDASMVSENRKSVFVPVAYIDANNGIFNVTRDYGVQPASYFAFRGVIGDGESREEGVQHQDMASTCNS